MGLKTFKPRFNQSKGLDAEGWRRDVGRLDKNRTSIWRRLGPKVGNIHDCLGDRVVAIKDRLGPRQSSSTNFLQLLKVKATGCCFNCFAKNHRIAECRDPPKCILCFRSGHKARHCR